LTFEAIAPFATGERWRDVSARGFEAGDRDDFPFRDVTGSAWEPSALLEFQTASGLAVLVWASMKGFGPRPFPAAICAIVRPDAMERSSASRASLSTSDLRFPGLQLPDSVPLHGCTK